MGVAEPLPDATLLPMATPLPMRSTPLLAPAARRRPRTAPRDRPHPLALFPI